MKVKLLPPNDVWFSITFRRQFNDKLYKRVSWRFYHRMGEPFWEIQMVFLVNDANKRWWTNRDHETYRLAVLGIS